MGKQSSHAKHFQFHCIVCRVEISRNQPDLPLIGKSCIELASRLAITSAHYSCQLNGHGLNVGMLCLGLAIAFDMNALFGNFYS